MIGGRRTATTVGLVSRATRCQAFLLFIGLPSLALCFSTVHPIPSASAYRARRFKSSDSFIGSTPIQEDLHDTLTKEELTLRFSEVLEYYRKTNEMSPENVCLSMLRTRLPDLRLNRCFVAQSTILKAGLGLFANREILEGELITLFPGDALLVWKKAVGDFSGDVGVMFGKHVANLDASRVSTDEARSYELKIGDFQSLVANPLLIADAAYLGHMANDGAILTGKDNKSRERYSKSTFASHNAAFMVIEGSHLATTATKRIAKNEEIFVSYGDGYWLSRVLQVSR